MNNVLLSILLIISSALLGNLVLYGIRKKEIPGVFFFSLLMTAMIIHSVGYAFELLSDTLGQMYFWIRIEYIGAAFYPFLIMLFAREYTDEKRFANKYLLTLMFTVGIITFLLVNTNSYHWLYYSSIGVDPSPGFCILALEKGMWYYVQVFCLCFSIIYSIIIFSIKIKRTRGDYRKKVIFMLIGVSIPMITLIIYMLGLGPVYIDLSPFSYFFMSSFIIIGLLRYDILFLAPVTHEMVFNSIEEAVLVVDNDELLINFNDASKRFFPTLAKIKIGDSIHLIQELKDYNFSAKQSIYEIQGKILRFKVIHIKNDKVRIYVVDDITESEQAKKQLEILATEDALTGLYNRRYFMEKVEASTEEGIIVIIDLDHFKSINDTFGHIEGDRVLRDFGGELKRFFDHQTVCRYGGEEFAIFMKGVAMEEGLRLIETMREKTAGMNFSSKVTFSAGMAECKDCKVSEALIHADRKLYEAKENGRNQTRCWNYI